MFPFIPNAGRVPKHIDNAVICFILWLPFPLIVFFRGLFDCLIIITIFLHLHEVKGFGFCLDVDAFGIGLLGAFFLLDNLIAEVGGVQVVDDGVVEG